MRNRDEKLLAEAYSKVYLKEGILPEKLKAKVESFISQYGQKINDFLQKKFPDFYQKLVATSGDVQKIRNLIEPLLQIAQQSTVQENIFSNAMSKLFSYNNIGNALIAVGIMSLGMADLVTKGPSLDIDLLISAVTSFLVAIYAKFIHSKENKV